MSEQKQNQVTKAGAGTTALATYAAAYDNQVSKMASDAELQLSKSQKLSVTIGAQNIFSLAKENDIDYKTLDQSNVAKVLFTTALLDLNPAATPRQVFYKLRNNYVTVKDANGRETKINKPLVEIDIQGDGNDELVRKYGVDVKSLKAPWIIREGDEFTFPYFDGEKMCPPTWKMKSLSAKAIIVVYVLTKTDGTIEYLMSDRESVATNLKAHIMNNIMGATKQSKNEVFEKIDNMNLAQLLEDKSLRDYKVTYSTYDKDTRSFKTETKTMCLLSPAYTGPAREEMIIRKMRNNCLKKYPKNFDNAFVQNAYESTFEEKNPQDIIDIEFNEKANTVEPTSVFKSVEENSKESTPRIDNNGVVQVQNSPVEAQKKEEDNLPDWMK